MAPPDSLSLIVRSALLPFFPRAEQTMGMPAIRRRWTTAEVRDLMDESRKWPRYELISGELIVTPAPGAAHQVAVIEIVRLILPYLEQQEVGITLTPPADLELQPGTITQPDIFVVPRNPTPAADARPTWKDITSLLLAVEIISPSSIRVDRVDKRDLYMEGGVAEYWIVDLDARILERWIPTRQTPEVLRTSLEWLPPGAATPLTIDLAELFDRIRTTYRQIEGR